MRKLCLISAVVILAGAWFGLGPWAQHSFSAHMMIHMSVVAVAAPLVAIGLAGDKWDPARKWPTFLAPVPLSLVELMVVWAWHAPALHQVARHTPVGFACEQGSFFLAGLLVWISALGGERSARVYRAGGGILALLLTSMHMTLLGALLALTPRPLYSVHAGNHGMSALQDQQLGGAIMILVGGVAYLAGGLWLSLGLLKQRVKTSEWAR